MFQTAVTTTAVDGTTRSKITEGGIEKEPGNREVVSPPSSQREARIQELEGQLRSGVPDPRRNVILAELGKVRSGGPLAGPNFGPTIEEERQALLTFLGVESIAVGAVVGGPAAVAAAERGAARGIQFMLDPRGGFAKGLGAGLANQLLFEGEAPIARIPGNNPFNFGLAVGNTVGAPLNVLLRASGVGL